MNGSTVSSRRGFTFLEILVALAILGASFTVLLAAHASASRTEAAARRLMTGTLLARQILTNTEVEGVPDFGGDSGDFGEAFPGYTWERNVVPVALPIETPFAIPTDSLREIHIQVSWPERGGTQTTDIVYYAFGETP